MSKFYEISEDTKKDFFDIFNKKSFPLSLNFQFVGSESQKNLIKISKISDQFSFLMNKDLLVSINEDLMSVFDQTSITILIEQEIDKINMDIKSGKIKMVKPDLSTFSSIISKYGVEKVAKANQVEELYNQQVSDGNQEFIV
jgi:hypothetical protein